jgi:hypothetical protein
VMYAPVGRTPWSAADAHVGLLLIRDAGPGGPARTRGSAPLERIGVPSCRGTT